MASTLSAACQPSTFNPVLSGGSILSIEANLVTDYSAVVLDTSRFIAPSVELTDATFCNVTVEYTHPGQNDNVFVEAWLPVEDWNGRLNAVGGGGWVAGRFALTTGMMQGAIADGFATVTTDAGVGSIMDLSLWALHSTGNVNLHKLNNFASVALHDQAVIGKSVIKSFYGRDPDYSYFTGCSTGGRMGLMLAQRYPNDYDGISAAAPALNNPELAPYLYWPQQVMNEMGEYPYPCEIAAIDAAAVAECDGLDGVEDGVISRPDECVEKFDPFSVVGNIVECPQTKCKQIRISQAAATVVNETWTGMPIRRGRGMIHGVRPGTLLSGPSAATIAATDCDEKECVGAPNFITADFIQYFLAKDPDIDIHSLSRVEFNELVYQAQYYNSIMASADPDLTPFRDAGGKIITMHGLADELIPPRGTEDYYKAVDDVTGNVHDFYRYFEVPGLGHCWGGKSGQPKHIMQQLMDWVERGTAPDSSPVQVYALGNQTHERIICPFPQRAEFDSECGDPAVKKCWTCR